MVLHIQKILTTDLAVRIFSLLYSDCVLNILLSAQAENGLGPLIVPHIVELAVDTDALILLVLKVQGREIIAQHLCGGVGVDIEKLGTGQRYAEINFVHMLGHNFLLSWRLGAQQKTNEIIILLNKTITLLSSKMQNFVLNHSPWLLS